MNNNCLLLFCYGHTLHVCLCFDSFYSFGNVRSNFTKYQVMLVILVLYFVLSRLAFKDYHDLYAEYPVVGVGMGSNPIHSHLT